MRTGGNHTCSYEIRRLCNTEDIGCWMVRRRDVSRTAEDRLAKIVWYGRPTGRRCPQRPSNRCKESFGVNKLVYIMNIIVNTHLFPTISYTINSSILMSSVKSMGCPHIAEPVNIIVYVITIVFILH